MTVTQHYMTTRPSPCEEHFDSVENVVSSLSVEASRDQTTTYVNRFAAHQHYRMLACDLNGDHLPRQHHD